MKKGYFPSQFEIPPNTTTITKMSESDSLQSHTHQYHVDYTSQGGPCLSYLWPPHDQDTEHSYSGAEVGCDSNIYCIPSQATQVLKIHTQTKTPNDNPLEHIGPTWNGTYKWTKGVLCGDTIYGFPCHADTVLRIHVPTGDITTIPIPYNEVYRGKQAEIQRHMTWKYRCGAISPMDGCLYVIPQSAWHVLQINPTTDTCKLVLSSPSQPGRNKWSDCVVGCDGAIYGIPQHHPSIIRIDPSSKEDIVSFHGNFPGTNKWDGAVAAPDGSIICAPASAQNPLIILPGQPPTVIDDLKLESGIPSTRHPPNKKVKQFAGATVGHDGLIYCIPNSAEHVLQIDTTRHTLHTVVPTTVKDTIVENTLHNKWQNGHFCGHNRIYTIPHSAETVLQIDTTCNTSPAISTWPLPYPCKGLAKWEGGIVTSNNILYCIPSNHKAILRISSTSLPEPFRNDQNDNTWITTAPVVKHDNTKTALRYNTGIPTLRSSAHRVKYITESKDDQANIQFAKKSSMSWLPRALRMENVLEYNPEEYDFQTAIATMLHECDDMLVGTFPSSKEKCLYNFCVPTESLNRGDYGGHCEEAQRYLSEKFHTNEACLELFDRFVVNVVLPHFKGRLVEANLLLKDEECTFFCQRPPTLRLQPGPARAFVNTHHDAKYGHQNGELNFWLPLTDRDVTMVDLMAESSHMKGDFHPLIVNPGQVVSFHGTSCRHFVNANTTKWTRVSLDFRIGVEGYFDPDWVMPGTTHDHDRKVIQL